MQNTYSIENFSNNGMAFPFDLKNKFENLENKYFEFQEKALKALGHEVTLKPNLLSKFFYNLSIDKSIIQEVKKIIGEDIYIWSSAFFPKKPGSGKIVSYHQDNPYWQLTTDNVVTAWIALTDSNKENGALEIVPGSSKYGLIKDLDVKNPREAYLKGMKTTESNDLLSYKQNLDVFMSKNKPEIIKLEKNQFSLHHVNSVHGSGVNNSSVHRIGFAVRYISSNTKHKMENIDSAIHVCGKKNKYFVDEVCPKQDFGEKEIVRYNKAMKATGAFGNKSYSR